jgi:hypothetical protein
MRVRENPNSIPAAAGDLMGASPLLSGLFQDNPTISRSTRRSRLGRRIGPRAWIRVDAVRFGNPSRCILWEGRLDVILELTLAAFLTTRGTASTGPPPPSPLRPLAVAIGGTELAHAIKTDIETISGPGSVDVSIDHETLYNVRVAVPGFRKELWTRIYDRVIELYRLHPDLNFDFYLRPKTAPRVSSHR